MTTPVPPDFSALLTDDQLRQGLAVWSDFHPVYRLSMVILTRDAADLTARAADEEMAEALLNLLESLNDYLKWRVSETAMLESALARLVLVVKAVADADETTTEEETDHGHS